jgi:hypothetical protein
MTGLWSIGTMVSGVNGGDKADHSAVQIQAIGRAPSGMTRALLRAPEAPTRATFDHLEPTGEPFARAVQIAVHLDVP